MNAFPPVTSRAVLLPVNDVDTDQIIPARFLKVTDKNGLGANLFADWRYRADGSPEPAFVLNQPDAQGAHLLLAGNNFGCGSSREHAPWALQGFGFQAVLAAGFADIFRNNALKNGLLPVQLTPTDHARLLSTLRAAPATPVTVDLASQQVRLPDGESFPFPIDAFSKSCLLAGVDEMGYLLAREGDIRKYEEMEKSY